MMFRSHPVRLAHVIPALCCAVFLLSAPLIHAADKPKEAAASKAKPKAPPKSLLMTRDELRQCMATKERLRVNREETLKTQDRLTKDKEEIDRVGKELQERLVTLDRTNQEAVDKFNVDTAARNDLIDAFKAGTTAFNAKVEVITAEREAYSKACENKRFDEDDEKAIKAGK
jgi:hypothetical protein